MEGVSLTEKTGAQGTQAFNWQPNEWSLGPILLWLAGLGTLFLIRVVVQEKLGYSATVAFIVPVIDFAYILGSILVTLMSNGTLKDIGITRKYSLLALALGLIVGFAIIGFRSIDPRFAGCMEVVPEPIPVLVLIIAGAYHALAEEVLFRGFFIGRLSRDLGWVPAVLISAVAYAITPFAILGADPTVAVQIEEIGRFFSEVFPALFALGIILALIYRVMGTIITTWFGVSLSIWTLGFIRGGLIQDMSFPVFSLAGYTALFLLVIIGIQILLKIHGREVLKMKDIKKIVE